MDINLLEYKEIITYIFAVGAAQGIFLFFVLLKKRENSFANKFLAVTMLVFALDLLGGVSYLSGFIVHITWILGLNSSLPYLYGPLIYLYVIFLIHEQDRFEISDYLHFIPFIIIQIYGLLFFYFESHEYQLGLLNPSIPNPWHIALIGKFIPIHGFTYMVITVLILVKFNKNIRNSLSNIEQIDFSWLVYLVMGTAVIWIVVVLSYMLDFVYGKDVHAHLLIYVTLSFFLYSFAFKSYKQPEITFRANKEGTDTYKKSGLTDEKAEEILNSVISYMNSNKPFLDTKLSLSELASKLNVSTHNLSEVINTKLNKNFYDFINSYRVEEVKQLIENDKDYTYSILAHGFDAGFTSKSAFYSAFKKFTGITPAKYRETILQD